MVRTKDSNDNVNSTGIENTAATILSNHAPNHTAPLLESSTGFNITYENLTCYNQSTTDINEDDVKNIFNWHRNSSPITVVNMPFEGGSNNTYTKDYSSLGNDGTVINAIWNQTGGFDGKGTYKFDGSGDYVNVGNNDSLEIDITNSDVTISAWIYPKVLDNYEPVFVADDYDGAYYGYMLMISPDGNIWLTYGDGTGTDTNSRRTKTGMTSLQTNMWCHVVGIIRGATDMSIYINDILNQTFTDTNSTTALINLTEGLNNLSFKSEDVNGFNWNNITVTLDTVAPNISIIGNLTQTQFEINFSEIFNVTDALSGLQSCTINITYLENVTNASQYDTFVNYTILLRKIFQNQYN